MPSKDVMKKFTKGKLHSGSAEGPVVTSAKQAVAIAASERDTEREHGGRYPEGRAKRGSKDSR